MTDPSGMLSGVVITSREIYDAVVRLTGRVDVLIAQQETTKSEIQDHEARLRSLESARWPLPAASVIISLAAIGITIVERFIT